MRANLEIIESSLAQLYVRQERLTAELREKDSFNTDILQRAGSTGRIVSNTSRAKASCSRRAPATLDAQHKQLEERKKQFKEEIGGIDIQLGAIEDSLKLLNDELKAVDGLYKRNIVTMQRVNDLRRQKSLLRSSKGRQDRCTRSGRRKRLREIDLQSSQLDKDRQVEDSKELADIESKVAELEQRRLTARDQLQRLNVTATLSGRVFQLNIHTVGGVVTPADTLMLIAPEQRLLTVEAKIATKDIDQVRTGQPVDIRFTAFDQRTTPVVVGHITSVAPDTVKDERTGAVFYPIRITPDPESLAQVKNMDLYPGMPAETFIKIGDRTVMTYLSKPLTDQIQHAFREE